MGDTHGIADENLFIRKGDVQVVHYLDIHINEHGT